MPGRPGGSKRATGMDAKALEMAREEFKRARSAAERTVTGEGHAALAEQWSLFLVYANRVFTKLGNGVKGGPAKGWWDGVKHTRKEDELLRYILHARNADEHGVERRVAPPIPAKPIGYTLGPFGMGRLVVPAATVMGPVYDRGVRYDPPTSHLGRPLNIGRPNLKDMNTFMALYLGTMERPQPFRVVSALAIDYLAKVLDEAEGFVACPD